MKNSFIALVLIVLFSCSNGGKPDLIKKSGFKGEVDEKKVELFTLKNENGLVTQITNYGGRVVSLWTPDIDGNFEDIVLGYETLDGYLNSNEIYFGALIGRYGNRIYRGIFKVNGKPYMLATNDTPNHLHGGIKGFNNVVWDANQIDENTLELSYLSKDMEEGYPGNLEVKVVYKLTDNDELKIEYWATTDKATHINLTHHSFFNLLGAGNGEILDHVLQINADYYTPINQNLIPEGGIDRILITPLDFNRPSTIGRRIDLRHPQLRYGQGYDHNYVLNAADDGLTYAAKVVEPTTKRTLEVYTNEPGLQFYSGNFLDGSDTGKQGKTYNYRTAFCLETQHYPDSPNNEGFPTTVLNPGEEYYSICVYKFGVEEEK